MPLQNRVCPNGDIVAVADYGTFMGNRGNIHDGDKKIVRPYRSKSWITCKIKYKNKRRQIMSPGRWTELFFLDEATAFSAGHRPCAFCRYPDFKEFKDLWLKANADEHEMKSTSILEIDKILHNERMDATKAKKTYAESLYNLPDGTLILLPERIEAYYLYYQGCLFAWSFQGYSDVIREPSNCEVLVLTPRSIVNTFKMGYKPNVHATALDF